MGFFCTRVPMGHYSYSGFHCVSQKLVKIRLQNVSNFFNELLLDKFHCPLLIHTMTFAEKLILTEAALSLI